ncbi:hypothetical protein DV735_g4705, partial [Chaetothyriales sp. CBS 134920]
MPGHNIERRPGQWLPGGHFLDLIPARGDQTHLPLKLIPFILIWLVFTVILIIWLVSLVAPVPRPPRRSEKTFRTVDQAGRLTEPEALSCWYDDLAKKTAAASKEDMLGSLDLAAEIEPADVFMTLVIPAYNEENRLTGMLEEAVNFLETEYGTSTSSKPPAAQTVPSGPSNTKGARNRKTGATASTKSHIRGWEIILVNDGSKDNTLGVCEEFARNHIVPPLPRRASGPWTTRSAQGVRIPPGAVRMVALEENRGKGGAVTHGMRHARGQYVVFADADGASKFDDLSKLVSACMESEDQKGRGVAVGSRAHLVGSEAVVKRSKLRNFLMHSFHLLLWLLTPSKTSQIRDTQCGFKLFSRPALPYIIPYMHMEGWIFDVEMLMLAEWSNIPVAEVPIGWREVVVRMDEEALKSFIPSSFGGGRSGFDADAQIESARRDSSDSSEDEDEDDEYPVSHEVVFKTHDRAVTSITLDPAGSRMITGSNDCTLKFHDFASMVPNTIRAFKSVDPTATKSSASSETHPIHTVKFNPNSPSQILVVSATPQARIMSRDGEITTEFIKGDMYLRDMKMTKGHVTGTDSTLRIWDVNYANKQKEVIVHKSKAIGSAGRSRLTAVAWGSQVDGGNSVLVSTALDGSLLMWAGDGPFTRPSSEIRDAHKPDTWTSGIDISSDGRLVVTRGGDDTIKLWDTRKFKDPINTTHYSSTSAQYPTSNIIFAPNSSSILAGSETGDLHILNPATLQPEVVTPIAPGSPLITVLWHEKLNQIITGSANGETHVLFNPKSSSKGALMILSKPPKRQHVDDDSSLTTDMSQGMSGDVVNPGIHSAKGVSTSGLTVSGKSRDPRRPHLPATTPFAKSQPDEEHIRKNIPLSSMREEDPREALLKYADKAKNDPLFTNAWKHTQPKTIYAELSDDDDDDGPSKKKQKT